MIKERSRTGGQTGAPAGGRGTGAGGGRTRPERQTWQGFLHERAEAMAQDSLDPVLYSFQGDGTPVTCKRYMRFKSSDLDHRREDKDKIKLYMRRSWLYCYSEEDPSVICVLPIYKEPQRLEKGSRWHIFVALSTCFRSSERFVHSA